MSLIATTAIQKWARSSAWLEHPTLRAFLSCKKENLGKERTFSEKLKISGGRGFKEPFFSCKKRNPRERKETREA